MMTEVRSCPRRCPLSRSWAEAFWSYGALDQTPVRVFLFFHVQHHWGTSGDHPVHPSCLKQEQSLALSPLNLLHAEQSQLCQLPSASPCMADGPSKKVQLQQLFPQLSIFQIISPGVIWPSKEIHRLFHWMHYLNYSSSSVSKMAIFNWGTRKY